MKLLYCAMCVKTHRLKPAVLKVKNIGRDRKASTVSIPLKVDTQTSSSQSIPEVGGNENIAEQDAPLLEENDLSPPFATAHEKRVLRPLSTSTVS